MDAVTVTRLQSLVRPMRGSWASVAEAEEVSRQAVYFAVHGTHYTRTREKRARRAANRAKYKLDEMFSRPGKRVRIVQLTCAK
jgi:hypothetical protein